MFRHIRAFACTTVVLVAVSGCSGALDDAAPTPAAVDTAAVDYVLSIESGDLDVGVIEEPNSLDDPEFDSHALSAVSDGLAFIDRSTVDPAIRFAAVRRLQLGGRTVEQADCIVNHLIDAGAAALVESDGLGLGADPVEAAALAACF
ncbi:MAG: hypothetical protein ACR2P0_18100 [Acidimicrobiales bacterium]